MLIDCVKRRIRDGCMSKNTCHAKEHLNEVAHAIYGKGRPEAEQWATLRKEELEDQRYRELRALGLCITSNIVESGCKVIFTSRFRHSAMH